MMSDAHEELAVRKASAERNVAEALTVAKRILPGCSDEQLVAIAAMYLREVEGYWLHERLQNIENAIEFIGGNN